MVPPEPSSEDDQDGSWTPLNAKFAEPQTKVVDQENADEIARVKMQLTARAVGSRDFGSCCSTILPNLTVRVSTQHRFPTRTQPKPAANKPVAKKSPIQEPEEEDYFSVSLRGNFSSKEN